MKNKKVWKKICLAWLSITCLLGVVIALFYVIENTSGRKAWERYVKECETKNQTAASDLEKTYLWIEDIIPPAVDEDKNFANTPLFNAVFRGELNKWKDEDTAKTWTVLLDRKPWHWYTAPNYYHVQHTSFGSIVDEATGERVQLSKEKGAQMICDKLEPCLASLKDIRQTLNEYPLCRYALQYKDGFDMMLPHLGILKRITDTATQRACANQILGQSDKAAEDLLLAMDLGNTISGEPSMVSVLVRAVIYNSVLNVIWEGMESDSWTQENLEQFQEKLKKVDFWNDMRLALMADRAVMNDCFQNDPRFLLSDFCSFRVTSFDSYSHDGWDMRAIKNIIPLGWCYRVMLGYNKVIDSTLACFDIENKCIKADLFPSVLKELSDPVVWNIRGIPADAIELFERVEICKDYPKFIMKCSRAQSFINAAQVACAVERYHMENKKYPDSLAELGELLPEDQLPRDWMINRPLQYHLTDAGYDIWSSGWNGTDEGGVRTLTAFGDKTSEDEGDWVWEITHASASNGK